MVVVVVVLVVIVIVKRLLLATRGRLVGRELCEVGWTWVLLVSE